MKPTEYQHFIFVRPPGSWTWTLHMTKPTVANAAVDYAREAWK